MNRPYLAERVVTRRVERPKKNRAAISDGPEVEGERNLLADHAAPAA